MKSLHNEDLDLQIKLAQLQTDVQMYLTISVSLMAVFFALIISFQQLSVQASEPFQIYIYMAGQVVSVILMVFVFSLYVNKMKDKRKEMHALKKQYVW